MTNQKPETSYSCKECGAPVKREGDTFKRDCGCDGPIVASLHATARGKSAFADEKRVG